MNTLFRGSRLSNLCFQPQKQTPLIVSSTIFATPTSKMASIDLKSHSYSTTSHKTETKRHHRKSLRITLIGPPGSGKGTQSAKIERDFNLTTISTGQILRTASTQDSVLGKQIRDILAKGELVPDDIMLSIIKESISSQTNGWILDGYPRNPIQASQLDNILVETEQPLTLVFYLDVPQEALFERLQERWIHPGSGRTYNMVYSPPKEPGKDDITGEPLVKRMDDNIETIKKRLDTYYESTFPLLDYYKKVGLLASIKSPTSDVGYVEIENILKKALNGNWTPSQSGKL
eukprot:TRINITY_DN5920_c0_g1_i1.p1 TRINITY_DN5920_c0_g1~~TRINITY_DN5920_c0_g1_i1.p1  ORF type:complete len:289 (-),score=60.41 TRINITY_DN5920_c0_g1_i1:71-937(-)